MNLINSIILGVVEGVTEFLPISSTAHLIITAKILKIPQTEFLKFFEVFIQAGAIFAVVMLYFKYVKANRGVIKKVMVSFIPTAIIGFLLHRIIKEVFFESLGLIAGSLFLIGAIFIIVEILIKKNKIRITKSIEDLSFKDSLVIGLGQSLAVVPGVSRAGIVMLTMMLRGYRRDQSAIYSFLLAVPTILAAAGYDLLKTDMAVVSDPFNLMILTVGFITSFITAYISVKWLIDYLKQETLIKFGIYRLTLSFLLYVL